MCDPVRSPTLCGSPTLIVKLGFEACSTLILCFPPLNRSLAICWPAPANLVLDVLSSSSSRNAGGTRARPLDGGGLVGEVIGLCDCSAGLDGGGGDTIGSSCGSELPPNGPNGSSAASRRAAGAGGRLPLGPRRGAVEAGLAGCDPNSRTV